MYCAPTFCFVSIKYALNTVYINFFLMSVLFYKNVVSGFVLYSVGNWTFFILQTQLWRFLNCSGQSALKIGLNTCKIVLIMECTLKDCKAVFYYKYLFLFAYLKKVVIYVKLNNFNFNFNIPLKPVAVKDKFPFSLLCGNTD